MTAPAPGEVDIEPIIRAEIDRIRDERRKLDIESDLLIRLLNKLKAAPPQPARSDVGEG